MRCYLALLFLLVGVAPFSAVKAQKRFQPGYLVLQRGDTVRGQLVAPTRSTMARGVLFRRDEKTVDEIFYSVKLLRGVSLTGGKKYVVRKMLPIMRRDTLRLLLEPLAQGQANLYLSTYNLYTNHLDEVYSNLFSTLYYYVESAANPTRPPYLLQSTTFRSDLASLFSDCSSAPAITGKFSEVNLIRLVQEYNTCASHLTQLK